MQATGERKPGKKTARTGETVSVLFINRDGADHRLDLDAKRGMLPVSIWWRPQGDTERPGRWKATGLPNPVNPEPGAAFNGQSVKPGCVQCSAEAMTELESPISWSI